MSTKLRLGLRRDESPLACSPIRLRSGQADVHALDLEAAHAVDVRRLEGDVVLLGPLGGVFSRRASSSVLWAIKGGHAAQSSPHIPSVLVIFFSFYGYRSPFELPGPFFMLCQKPIDASIASEFDHLIAKRSYGRRSLFSRLFS